MRWRPSIIAVARVANGVVLLGAAAFCFLSYSPFAYEQFIKPNVVPDLNDLVVLSPWLFTLALLVTVLTLLPPLGRRRAPGRAAAIAYVAVTAVTALWALWRRPLTTIGHSRAGFMIGLAAAAYPVALALVDHQVWPPPPLAPADRMRAVRSTLLAALAASATYALCAQLSLARAVGIELSAAAFAVAVAVSTMATLTVFTIVLFALLAILGAAEAAGQRASVAYWLTVGMLAAAAALVCYLLVCESLSFTGPEAAIASGALGAAVAAIWADVARLRVHSHWPDRVAAAPPGSPLDALAAFVSPIAGIAGRRQATVVLVAMPLVAYGLLSSVSHLDWNFLLQKLGVLLVWLTIAAAVYAIADGPSDARWAGAALAVAAIALGGHAAAARIERRSGGTFDRYAALDPSFRLIRDAETQRSAETAEYYEFLRSHTLVPRDAVQPPSVELVEPPGRAGVRPPHIFLFVIDSLRRDYVSPYNPAVTFTPEIGRLAADSFVFDRAFTRYSGTPLSIAGLWRGGMTIHTLEHNDFAAHNTLLKLLDANRYVRIMDFDHVVTDLVPNDANAVQLDRGKGTMDVDLCATTTELESQLSARDTSRPVFFYSLPQNVHIAVAGRRQVAAGEKYPGFFAPVASSVGRIDACFGRFVQFLKQTRLYDDSVIIVTADHGDSLGEGGRWGHAYFMVPEVMRIPLIVHVPARLRARVAVDLAALTFSTDITPSLYALLGYDPAERGPLFGRTVFTPPDGDSSWRWRSSFLVASAYGPVYGILRHNGRRMDVVDAVNNEEYAYDMTGELLGRRIAETPAAAEDSRRTIAQQLKELAAIYRYQPRH
jgi:hypothetical protein